MTEEAVTMHRFWTLSVFFLLLVGCGRYFAGPIRPIPEGQESNMTVKDDGSISYIYERLEINLRPITDAELNRQFSAHSKEGAESTNPYTYGDWKPMGDVHTPQRFTVFGVQVKNYTYPKMRVDPYKVEMVSENRRQYSALALETLLGYYRAFAVAQAGNAYVRFSDRKDILRRTLFPDNQMLFSGQEEEGFIVFPKLDDDVKDFSVTLKEVVLRFDYQDAPLEETELTFRFHRELHKGYYPPSSMN